MRRLRPIGRYLLLFRPQANRLSPILRKTVRETGEDPLYVDVVVYMNGDDSDYAAFNLTNIDANEILNNARLPIRKTSLESITYH